jgi:hypothetical protein
LGTEKSARTPLREQSRHLGLYPDDHRMIRLLAAKWDMKLWEVASKLIVEAYLREFGASLEARP